MSTPEGLYASHDHMFFFSLVESSLTSFMLSMIILGKQMPGNDIDVCLQPLTKELKELWFDGVQTFDYSNKEMFTL